MIAIRLELRLQLARQARWPSAISRICSAKRLPGVECGTIKPRSRVVSKPPSGAPGQVKSGRRPGFGGERKGWAFLAGATPYHPRIRRPWVQLGGR